MKEIIKKRLPQMDHSLEPTAQTKPVELIHLLAKKTDYRGLAKVELPEPLAENALAHFFEDFSIQFHIVREGEFWSGNEVKIAKGMWGLVFPEVPRYILRKIFPLGLLEQVVCQEESCYGVLFEYLLVLLLPECSKDLLRSLEASKPLVVNQHGLPHAWVRLDQKKSFSTQNKNIDIDDAIDVSDDKLEAFQATEAKVLSTNFGLGESEQEKTDWICDWFDKIRKELKLPSFPLMLRKSKVNQYGFVSGKVWFSKSKKNSKDSLWKRTPLRMLLTLCPNADKAEILATLFHEFSHLISGKSHNKAFCFSLLRVSKRVLGDDKAHFFAEAENAIIRSHREVDQWLALSLREILREGSPPLAKEVEEGQLVKIVSRVQRLRALATDQPGTPEGITATAISNQLITTYGLGGYQVRLDTSLDEQMIDRWVDIGRRKPWRRSLAFGLADFCNVFALSRDPKGWMHFFGKYRDVVAAEYLFGVCSERIVRQCEAYIKEWKNQEGSVTGGQTRSEKISFCDSAVEAIREKMYSSKMEQNFQGSSYSDKMEAKAYHLTREDLEKAGDFALNEHEKRGLGWKTGRSRVYRHNEKGYEAGKAVNFHSGIGNSRTPKGLLKG